MLSVQELTKACRAECLAPEGWATKLQEQVNKWRGGISMAGKVLAVALVLLTATVTIAIATVPSLVRSAARNGVREEVRSAVAEEFTRHFGRASEAGRFEKDLAKAAWQVVPSAHAEGK
jgi:hypothetical protein